MSLNSNQKNIMKIAVNAYQDKQQLLSDISEFSNLANIAYNKAINIESNYEKLSKLLNTISEITINNDKSLIKINKLLENTQTKISTDTNLNITAEMLETKNMIIEQNNAIELNLKNIDIKFNTNLDKFNEEIIKITSTADKSLNIAIYILNSLNDTYSKLKLQIENMPKTINPKLYGNLNKIFPPDGGARAKGGGNNSSFNGLMVENSIYLINTDTELLKIDNNLIFKTNTKYSIINNYNLIDITENFNYNNINFFSYTILEESINYITEFGLYVILKNSDLVKFSHQFNIYNFVDNDQFYLVSNNLLCDSFIEINKQKYICGPYCDISNYDIYESEKDETILEIFIKEKINNIEIDIINTKYFYIKENNISPEGGKKYYLMAKEKIDMKTFESTIKLILYIVDKNDIKFPRIFFLKISQSILSFNDIIIIENNSLKLIILEYYNIIKNRSLVFFDLSNLIQTIIPNNCQIIKILSKQNVLNSNIYTESNNLEIKNDIISFNDVINKLILTHTNISKDTNIDGYFELIDLITNLIILTKKILSPNNIIDLSDKYIFNLDNLFKIIKSYLLETRYDSKQYNIHKYSNFINLIFNILLSIKDMQINLISELNIFNGF